MSFNHNPNIVRNGLVLCLDAKDLKSYSGSGTTWVDRSGNGNNGTLVNGVSYSNGAMVFDGVDDYVSIPGITLNTNTGFTIDLWININDPQEVYNNFWCYWYNNSNDFEFGTYGSGTSQGKFIVKDNSAGVQINSPYIGNQWANIIFGCNATKPFISTNGNFISSNNSFRNTNLIINSLLRGSSGSGTSYYKAKQSSIRIYNRALSQAEILQNFNAQKGRYGI